MDGPNDADDLDRLRDVTLQKIGRNCVNFANMEALLRFIATSAQVSAPVKILATVLSAEQKRHRRTGMGSLADVAADVLHSPAAPPPEPLTEPWFRFEISLAEGGSVRNEWRSMMRQVVRERNRLIHQRLAQWNPRSAESCQALCAELDAQRERMRGPHEHLISVVNNIREAQAEAAQALRSDWNLD